MSKHLTYTEVKQLVDKMVDMKYDGRAILALSQTAWLTPIQFRCPASVVNRIVCHTIADDSVLGNNVINSDKGSVGNDGDDRRRLWRGQSISYLNELLTRLNYSHDSEHDTRRMKHTVDYDTLINKKTNKKIQ